MSFKKPKCPGHSVKFPWHVAQTPDLFAGPWKQNYEVCYLLTLWINEKEKDEICTSQE